MNCFYHSWANSHYISDWTSSNFDLDSWKAKHTFMLHKVTAEMMTEG
jgi:hypothetical protein